MIIKISIGVERIGIIDQLMSYVVKGCITIIISIECMFIRFNIGLQ